MNADEPAEKPFTLIERGVGQTECFENDPEACVTNAFDYFQRFRPIEQSVPALGPGRHIDDRFYTAVLKIDTAGDAKDNQIGKNLMIETHEHVPLRRKSRMRYSCKRCARAFRREHRVTTPYYRIRMH
jgi:hypothetical protein